MIKKSQAKKFKQPTCSVLEYGGTDELDIAVAKIKERYPERGRVRNTKCTMMFYVLAGGGKIYQVIGTARHSETLEEMVAYQALYEVGILVKMPCG